MHGKPFGKIGYARFRRAVCRDFGERSERIHRRNIDDVPACFDHVFCKHLRHQKRRRNIKVKHEFKPAFFKGEKVFRAFKIRRHNFVVGGRFGIISACAVDKEVDLSELFDNFFFGFFDFVFVKAVAPDGKRVFANLVRDFFRRVEVYVQKRDFCAALRKRTGKFRANHTARARYCNNFVT